MGIVSWGSMGVKITFVRDIFQPLLHYIKFPKIWIDNTVFRLHCKASAFLIFACCIVVSMGQFFGDPIDCIVDTIPGGVMDTYCWIHSTFTLPKHVDDVGGRPCSKSDTSRRPLPHHP